MLNRWSWSGLAAGIAVLSLTTTPIRADDKARTLAQIKLSGLLPEGPASDDPLLGSVSENFKAKLDRIKKASKDDTVLCVLLEVEGVALGWAQLDELSHAIADCRKAGKKVFAHLEAAGVGDYLLGLACDEVCMPESGMLLLTGLRAEVSFYKGLFDKIGVQADFLQMGDFKGAVEPFTRTSLSEPNRKQLNSVLDDRFEHGIVERIVKARPDRKWNADEVKKLIDQGPYTARAAKKAGLIDRLAYADDYQEELKKVLKAPNLKLVKNYGKKKSDEIDFSNPFALLKLFAPSKSSSSSKPKVAVIYATGAIMTGKGGSSLMGGEVCGSTTMVEAIRQAEKDKTVKAIVLRVNSPGGSALASDLIWNELVQSKKPVIASMGDVAASGGYYISMAAKKIYADPGTLTGSIGVFGGKLTLGGLYDKVGITTETLSRGANAGVFSTTHPFSKSEREAMTLLLRDIYDQFLTKALQGRQKAGKDMNRSDLEKLAAGRIWTGRQAKENGLVDVLGSLEDAIAAAAKMGGLPEDKETELLILPKHKSFFEMLLDSKSDSEALILEKQLPLLRQMPELQHKLRTVEALLRMRGEGAWLMLPYQVEMK